jgi:hypothetical protein
LLKYQIHLKAPFFFIIFILSIIGFVPTNHLYAQAKKKPVKKATKQINRMVLEMSRPDSVVPYMITAEGDTINRTDEFNLKQGVWVERTEERFGEPAFTKIGNYKDNWKKGKWTTYVGPEVVSIENFNNNVLDGEILFFENGFLTCRGYYMGSNYRTKYDTIDIMNEQTTATKTYIVTNSPISVKDSTWTYYAPNSKKITRLEFWNNDEFMGGQEFGDGAKDSISMANYEKSLPHRNKNVVVPFSKDSRGKAPIGNINKAAIKREETIR